MIIDVAILDYNKSEVHLISLDVPMDYDGELVEGMLSSLGYNLDEISYMTSYNMELNDER